MPPFSKSFLTIMALMIGGVSSSRAADPTYWQDVRPILRKHCTVCHNERKLDDPDVSAGLALNTLDLIRKGGKVAILKPGKPKDSLLVTLLTEKNLKRRMPLDADPLASEEIELLRKWVELGALEGKQPADTETVATAPRRERKVPRLMVAFPAKAVIGKQSAAEPKLAIGPLSPITAVAYTPDGTKLAVGSYGSVVLWDLTLARPVQVITEVLAAVNDVKFSPDGKLLAVSGGQPSVRGDLRIFSVSTGKMLRQLGGHADVVSAMAFSPDGKKLASSSFDKTVRLWDVDSGERLHTFVGHSDFVYSVAFSPTGEWYATASKDRTVRVVDIATGTSRFTFSGMDQEVLAVAVRSDGKQVVSSGFESQLYWWDTQTGERVRRQGGHDVAVYELTMDRDSTMLISAGADKTARLWNPQTGAAIRTLSTGSVVYAVALDPTAKRAVAGAADGMVRVFDASSGKLLVTLWAKDPQDWFATTPEGLHLHGDRTEITWHVSGKPLTDSKPYRLLFSEEVIRKGLSGK